MWEISEHRALQRQIPQLSPAIRRRYEVWKDVARLSGPDGVRAIRGFRDEKIRGERAGWRISELAGHGRVMYQYLSRKFWVVYVG